jgi:glycosyltransferase involved in cell wall biosynthesis
VTHDLSISVVIPSYNAANWIGEALDSVLSQGALDLQVIVVDDGSEDDTVAVVKTFPGVTVAAVAHHGPSRARNIGTELATGRFIQYLDADDRLAPFKLQRQRDVLIETGADVAYGDWRRLVRLPDGSWSSGEVVRPRLTGNPQTALLRDFWCPPAAYLFSREIVRKVGAWNETLAIIQDARFALDCVLHGGRFVHCEGLMADYRVHSQQSVSQRDPVAFLGDCLRNAEQVEAWWRAHGGLTHDRVKALTSVHNHIARVSYRRHADLFERAFVALRRLNPRRIPHTGTLLSLISRVVGYRRAEALAYLYRTVRGSFSAR